MFENDKLNRVFNGIRDEKFEHKYEIVSCLGSNFIDKKEEVNWCVVLAWIH